MKTSTVLTIAIALLFITITVIYSTSYLADASKIDARYLIAKEAETILNEKIQALQTADYSDIETDTPGNNIFHLSCPDPGPYAESIMRNIPNLMDYQYIAKTEVADVENGKEATVTVAWLFKGQCNIKRSSVIRQAI